MMKDWKARQKAFHATAGEFKDDLNEVDIVISEDLLTDIVVSAPALAQYLGGNSGVLDAVLSGEFFAPWPGTEALAAQLTEKLAVATDYESGLDLARIWTKEWHFRIGVHLLEGLATPRDAASHYAQLAEAVLTAVFDFVHQNFALKYGHIPDSDCAILAMGSLGAGQLNSQSDLDMILIFDADVNAQRETSVVPPIFFAIDPSAHHCSDGSNGAWAALRGGYASAPFGPRRACGDLACRV